jgi:glycosyltransferase involved in cell wall biosynthesis
MNKQRPRVSIGLPVYNGEEYLRKCLNSILAQTYQDFELIISDNASLDGTEAICREYASRDSRIRYYRNSENLGANPNFNRTVELAQGDYFKWMAYDDILAPTYLARCVEVLEQNPTVVLCHTQTVFIDRDGDVIPYHPQKSSFVDKFGSVYPKEPPKNLDALWPHQRYEAVLQAMLWCYECFGMMRLDQLRSTGLFGDYYGADKVLLSQMCLLGPFAEVPEPLFFNRRHFKQSISLPTSQERLVWSSTNKKNRWFSWPFPGVRGHLYEIAWAGLNRDERLACLKVLMRWFAALCMSKIPHPQFTPRFYLMLTKPLRLPLGG